MIKELSELGKKLGSDNTEDEWIHNALKDEPLSIELIIKQDGSYEAFKVIETKLTKAEAITAKKGKARLLLDKAEEVLGYGGDKSKKKHQLFLEKLDEYKDINKIEPVLEFYYKNKADGIKKALKDFEKAIPNEKERKGNIGFRISSQGDRVHEKSPVLRSIIKKYEESQKEQKSESETKCSICGSAEHLVADLPHGMIKRVPDGQTSGCALVSYNVDAFESYQLKGNYNSSVCTNCAKTYVEGLNWLLSNGNEIMVTDNKGKEKPQFRYTNRKNFGSDTAIVFWTKNNKEVNDIRLLEEPDAGEVARLIDSIQTGAENKHRHLDEDQFYSCTLSGAAARIAVRDWLETSLGDFKKSIAKWFLDIGIDEYDWDQKKMTRQYTRLYDLARSCQRANSDGSHDKKDPALARAATSLWNAAIKNTLPPIWMLTKVLQRSRLDKWGITADKAAVIKLILNRHHRGGGFVIKESLQEGQRPIAYVCGQLFAKMESVQYAALGDKNAGIRERYFTYAMTTPASAFGRLFSLNSKHFTKLKNEKPGLAVNMDKEMQELCKEIDINNFPTIFTLEEQGQFAIGYYHQKQAQFNKSNKQNQEEN
jgi:CRISPR-associated protein Csd1